jgi:phage-related tail fiber protein
LSGTQTIDGVVLNAGDRVLVKTQTAGKDNGIYVVAAGAWTRATDADTSAKLGSGTYVNVNEGTDNTDTGFVLTTDGAITLGTTALVFQVLNLLKMPVPVKGNLSMTALATLSDFDPACATTISKTPALNSAVMVDVNGLECVLGDGVKTGECFFSSDLGVTAKTLANIVYGDKLYWVGSVAGYQLATTDKISIIYNAV